jgi:hypothetical protein
MGARCPTRVLSARLEIVTGGSGSLRSTGGSFATSTGSLPNWCLRQRNRVVLLPIPPMQRIITSNIPVKIRVEIAGFLGNSTKARLKHGFHGGGGSRNRHHPPGWRQRSDL